MKSTADPGKLIQLSIESLEPMQLSSGLFCNQILKSEAKPLGCSLRYSLIALLGLQKAEATGYSVKYDLRRIENAVFREVGSSELTPGDFGLYLFADSRCGGRRTEDLISRLLASLARHGGYPVLNGMEISWMIMGLCATFAANGSKAVVRLIREALDQLLIHNRSKSNLFFHHGRANARRRFPNFATQIYIILALATVARFELDPRALEAACCTADILLELQLSDHAWPWIFDAKTGRIVEPYEIYSVHQDAMAPMALFALAEVTSDAKYTEAALSSLEWIYGHNELSLNMIDKRNKIILRSIRRTTPWNRLFLYANTVSAISLGHSMFRDCGPLEVNPSCRPYHFGWILEAWCGRHRMPDTL